ncbi:hypothetical protein G7Z17_g8523 [Cylindrodendrum hubeiense]|uniref:Flavin-containing monooxygenase n=1 Tax=Cylindrodendrum hubeiense TaxID=595255 RepID=A0A9P5H1W4_9HYPO|nr:hypothetical protein G7Z17_g8523 [Cylindrodendrum hubeiense]
MAPEKQLEVSRVAIIGAGASGLAAAKYLLAEKKFSEVRIFEQRATPGGTWNYSPLTREPNFTIPRTQPSAVPDQAIWPNGSVDVEFLTPIYDQLETNIPHSLMSFADKAFPQGTSVFPRHSVVLQYLKDYAEGLEPSISYQTQVLNVEKSTLEDRLGPWKLQVLNLKTNETTKAEFDAIVVASGHYNDPFIPDIPGLVDFNKAYPEAISHSKFYRHPEEYANKKVIIVGNSASGIDMTAQISTVAQLPVLVSEKEKSSFIGLAMNTPTAAYVPEILEFLPQERGVRFSDGHIETGIDAVILCTGFHYSYPFLQSLKPSVLVPSGTYAAHLWENMIYTADPTLAFLSIPQRGIPFPLVEAQSAVISRIWSGRLNPPSRAEMEAWVHKEHQEKGEGKPIHHISCPADVEYINRLHNLSTKATRAPELGLDRGGDGKEPPYWDLQKRWVRERVLEIKLASRAQGDRRHEFKSLEDLGFDYAQWEKDLEGGKALIS